ncbi:hypothetical protein BIU82_14175 [Arthrobacter sp. SW1]|nr:hypothetical protein BIU82_14175 [Arthrobacter sp. SW1]
MSWTKTTLGEVCASGGGAIQTGPFGSQLHASDYVETGVPSVMPQNIGDNAIVEEGIARITEADATRLAKHRLRPNDIVYSRRGDVERRALVRPENAGWLCGTGCLKVSFGDAPVVSPAFISYYLGTEESREWIVRHAVGATMLNLNTKILAAIPLTLPPRSEQEAIAEVLGALDDKIAANTKLATTADSLAVAEFQHAVRDVALSEQTFADLATVSGGGTPSTKVLEYWDGNISWATPTDVTPLSGPYLESTSRSITEAGLTACASSLYPAGSILMTSRATIGAFAFAQKPMAVNQGFIVVQPTDTELSPWIFHEMRSRVDEFIAHANGATFLELSRGKFKSFKVRLSTSAAMNAFGKEAARLHEVASHALRENRTLAATRDALLPQLMSGKLRVKDAEAVLEQAGV